MCLFFTGLSARIGELEAVPFTKKILTQISTDPLLGLLPNSPGWQVQQLSLALLKESWTEPALVDCADLLLKVVSDAANTVPNVKYAMSGELKMLQAITNSSLQLSSQWVQLVQTRELSFSDSVCNNLFQFAIDKLIPAISQELIEAKTLTEKPYVCLSLEEKQVLHYAAGYIPRKLLRRYQRSPKNKAAQIYADVVRTWCSKDVMDEDGSQLSDPVTYWTRLQDRGGLIHCSAKFFQFMKVLESSVQEILNWKTLPNYAGQDITLAVGGKVKAKADVKLAFQSLIEHALTSDQLCEVLLDQVIVCWVGSKSRQVAKQYIYYLKQSKHGEAARLGTPAFRKTLDK